MNLVIGFGPSLGLALWPRAKPIKKEKKCFAPTSTVETREGVKTIPELLIGDEIRTSADNLDTTGFTEVCYILIEYLIYP